MKDSKFFAMVMEAKAAELSLRYRQNSMAYRILYHDGLGFARYKTRLLSSILKIFER
ncbi:hypothetical protein ACFLVN_02125 [Chloroflexota bacterium]